MKYNKYTNPNFPKLTKNEDDILCSKKPIGANYSGVFKYSVFSSTSRKKWPTILYITGEIFDTLMTSNKYS